MIKLKHYPLMDRLGMSLSIICAIHCIGTPFILIGAPWLKNVLHDEFFHLFMFLLVFPLAVLSLGQTRSRNSNKPFFMGITGLFFLALGPVMHEFFDLFHSSEIHFHEFHYVENILTVFGGGLLFFAHLMNLKSCRCGHDHSKHHSKKHSHQH